MSVPQFKEFLKPVLTFMSDGDLYTKKELREKVIDYFKLSEEDVNEKTSSGKSYRIKNRVSWTLGYLKKSKLINLVSRGKYQITTKGINEFKEGIGKSDEYYFEKFKKYRKIQDNGIGKSVETNIVPTLSRLFFKN